MGKKNAILLVSVIIFGVLSAVSISGCGDTRLGFEEVMAKSIKAAAEVETYSMEAEGSNRAPISSHRSFSDMFAMVTGLDDIKELDDEVIYGVDCYHYIGRNKVEENVTEQSPSLGYERNYTEFWIGKDDFFLRKVYINEYPGVIESRPGEATFTFSRFNDPEGPEPE